MLDTLQLSPDWPLETIKVRGFPRITFQKQHLPLSESDRESVASQCLPGGQSRDEAGFRANTHPTQSVSATLSAFESVLVQKYNTT